MRRLMNGAADARIKERENPQILKMATIFSWKSSNLRATLVERKSGEKHIEYFLTLFMSLVQMNGEKMKEIHVKGKNDANQAKLCQREWYTADISLALIKWMFAKYMPILIPADVLIILDGINDHAEFATTLETIYMCANLNKRSSSGRRTIASRIFLLQPLCP